MKQVIVDDLTLWLVAVFLLGVLIGAVTVMVIEVIQFNKTHGGKYGKHTSID